MIWTLQYLKDENFYYLVEIGDDGIETEMFFMTTDEVNKYMIDNNLSSIT